MSDGCCTASRNASVSGVSRARRARLTEGSMTRTGRARSKAAPAADPARPGTGRRRSSGTGRARGRSGARRSRRVPLRPHAPGPRVTRARAGQDAVDPKPEERRRLFDCQLQPLEDLGGPGRRGPSPEGRSATATSISYLLLPLVEPIGSGLSGGVGIERQHQPRREPLDQPNVVFGQCGAARGNRPRACPA